MWLAMLVAVSLAREFAGMTAILLRICSYAIFTSCLFFLPVATAGTDTAENIAPTAATAGAFRSRSTASRGLAGGTLARFGIRTTSPG